MRYCTDSKGNPRVLSGGLAGVGHLGVTFFQRAPQAPRRPIVEQADPEKAQVYARPGASIFSRPEPVVKKAPRKEPGFTLPSDMDWETMWVECFQCTGTLWSQTQDRKCGYIVVAGAGCPPGATMTKIGDKNRTVWKRPL